MSDLKLFENNVYSQNGEDGVIKEILKRLKKAIKTDRWCVEFGAWDGVHLSNTCRLIREENYRAVLIEGDPKRVEQLFKNFPQSEVVKVCRFVGFEGENTIDKILSETPIPVDFDFLSIDIDGVDYFILESITAYTPKVICVEFNPTIPNCVDYVQKKKFGVKHGSSALALVRLAKDKGYTLVHATACNLIFVRCDLTSLILDNEPTLEQLNIQGNTPTFLFVGYDGMLLSNKSSVLLPWHGINVPTDWFQPLPKILRIYGGDYGFFRRICFIAWITYRQPRRLLQKIKQRLSL